MTSKIFCGRGEWGIFELLLCLYQVSPIHHNVRFAWNAHTTEGLINGLKYAVFIYLFVVLWYSILSLRDQPAGPEFG